eukprot:gene6815-biopygen1574
MNLVLAWTFSHAYSRIAPPVCPKSLRCRRRPAPRLTRVWNRHCGKTVLLSAKPGLEGVDRPTPLAIAPALQPQLAHSGGSPVVLLLSGTACVSVVVAGAAVRKLRRCTASHASQPFALLNTTLRARQEQVQATLIIDDAADAAGGEYTAASPPLRSGNFWACRMSFPRGNERHDPVAGPKHLQRRKNVGRTSGKRRGNVGKTLERRHAPEARKPEKRRENVGKTSGKRRNGSRLFSAWIDLARGADAWQGETLRKGPTRETSESRRGNVGRRREDVGRTSGKRRENVGRRRENVGKTSGKRRENVGIGWLRISGWPVQVLGWPVALCEGHRDAHIVGRTAEGIPLNVCIFSVDRGRQLDSAQRQPQLWTRRFCCTGPGHNMSQCSVGLVRKGEHLGDEPCPVIQRASFFPDQHLSQTACSGVFPACSIGSIIDDQGGLYLFLPGSQRRVQKGERLRGVACRAPAELSNRCARDDDRHASGAAEQQHDRGPAGVRELGLEGGGDGEGGRPVDSFQTRLCGKKHRLSAVSVPDSLTHGPCGGAGGAARAARAGSAVRATRAVKALAELADSADRADRAVRKVPPTPHTSCDISDITDITDRTDSTDLRGQCGQGRAQSLDGGGGRH